MRSDDKQRLLQSQSRAFNRLVPSADQMQQFSDNLARARAAQPSWPEPEWAVLEDKRGSNLPEFPLNHLPNKVADWVGRAAQGAAVTPAHVAVPLIAIASGLIGTARRVRPSRSWSEPMAIWASVVGYSGTGKTPGIDTVKRALAKLDRDRRESRRDARLAHEAKVEAAKQARKEWVERLKQLASKDVVDLVDYRRESGAPQPMPPEAMDPGEYVEERLFTSDPTIERLAELINARPRGMLLIRDELSGLYLNISRYSGGTDTAFWLEAWNGGSYAVDRMGRHVSVDYLLVAICGGLQPDLVARAFEGDQDGMYARVCFAWPSEPAYAPLDDTISEDDPEIYNAVDRLTKIEAGEGNEGKFAPRAVPLSGEARSAFEDFRLHVFRSRAELDGRDKEWWAKAPTHALRLSGVLAYLEWGFELGAPEPTEISGERMEGAIGLVRDYFWPHGRASIRQIGLNEKNATPRKALKWIQGRSLPEVSVKDLRREAFAGALDEAETKGVLSYLGKAGWLREVVHKQVSGPGRPQRRWEVNPALWGAAGNAPN